MVETQQIYFLAAAVVVVSLTSIGFFLREAITVSTSYQQGVTLYQQRDYVGAEVAFREVISRHPSNDIAHLLLGNALMQQDNLEGAIAEFRDLSRRAPKNVDAHLRLGTALLKQDNLEEAIAALQQARDLFKAQRNTQKADSVEQILQEIRTKNTLA